MNSFFRRDFLRGATALAGTTLLPSALTRLARAQNQTAPVAKTPTQMARGIVYLDRDGNGKRAMGDPGVAGVRVSNGRDVVVTDAQGRYEIPVSDDTIIFVQKPSGYRVPLNARNQPQFYYIHKPAGSPTNYKYAGIAPTGALPTSIDFALQKQDEPKDFRVLVWGDPQPRNLQEIDYIARDIVTELVGVKAAFGISLGDNAFNDLNTFEPLADVTSQMGLPWYSTIGNHDMNFESLDDELSAETYKRVFGPTYYSLDYGNTHFVVLDNVKWLGPDAQLKNGNYTGAFGERQLAWLKNDLALVPREKLVVLMMHIPIAMPSDTPSVDTPGKPPRFIEEDRRAFLNIVQEHPRTVSISGHTHVQYHTYVGREDGWNGAEPHHHFNCGTTSGSWWSGAPDEQGIPNTTMRDGTPNGYAFLNVTGNDYTIDWQAARSRSDYQMTVYTPSQIEVAQVVQTPLEVNFFNGCPKSRVEYKIGNGAWTPLTRIAALDPGYEKLKEMEVAISGDDKTPKAKKVKLPWRALPAIDATPHLWQTKMPALPVGVHSIQVRATDRWNRIFEERRLVRVV